MSESQKISLRERIRLNLNSAMEKAGINQVQLADKLGISKGTVNNWARGNNSPDVDMVPKICDVLGISIVEFYSPTNQEFFEKTPPSAEDSAPEGDPDPKILNALNEMLVSVGMIQDGEDLTDRQAEVLMAVCTILEAVFDN